MGRSVMGKPTGPTARPIRLYRTSDRPEPLGGVDATPPLYRILGFNSITAKLESDYSCLSLTAYAPWKHSKPPALSARTDGSR
jgi:hypothetical protein